MSDTFLGALAARLSAPTGYETGSDISAPAAALNQNVGAIGDAVQKQGAQIAATTTTRTSSGHGDMGDAPRVLFRSDGKKAYAAGHVFDLTNYQSFQALAQLDDKDLPPITQKPGPDWEPTTPTKIRTMFDAIPAESGFWRNAGSMAERTVGTAVSAIQRQFTNERADNPWSRTADALDAGSSLGQQKANADGAFGSGAGFANALGRATGGIGSVVSLSTTAAAAAPLEGIGALTGVTLGTTSAFGAQADVAYDRLTSEMNKLDDQSRQAQSPFYAHLRAQGLSEQDSIKQTASYGAKAAGAPAAALALIETAVGARLLGNALNRVPGLNKLAGKLGVADESGFGLPKALADKLENIPGVVRVAGRTATAAGFTGADMAAQTGFGQANASRETGFGSSDPRDYVDRHTFEEGALMGGLVGLFGGSHAPSRPGVDPALEAATATIEGRRDNIGAPIYPDGNGGGPGALDGMSRQDLGRAADAALAPQDPQQRMDILQHTMESKFGPGWANNIDQLVHHPVAGPVLQEMATLANQLRTRLPPDAAPGQQGAMDLPVPQQPQQPAHMGMPPAPEEAAAAPEPNPAQADAFPLGNRTFEDVQADMRALNDEMTQKFGPKWRSSKQAARTKVGKDAAAKFDALLGEAETLAPPAQVQGLPPDGATPVPLIRQTPEPLAGNPARPPADMTADGRPIGVAPPPLPNPEPMSPEEAAARQQTQAQRGEAPAGVPGDNAAAASSEQAVTPSTPEPAADLAAQLKALADPNNPKDAVFVAAGNEGQIPAKFKKGTVKGVRVAVRPEGTLFTTSDRKLIQYRSGKLNDNKLAKILGYPVTKAETLRSADPVVVTGTDKQGAAVVAAVTPKERAQAAAKKLAKQTPADGKVVVSSAEEAQAARAENRGVKGTPVAKGEVAAKSTAAKDLAKAIAKVKGEKSAPKLGPKAAEAKAKVEAKAKGRERSTPKKAESKPKADDERKAAGLREHVAAEKGPEGDTSRAELAKYDAQGVKAPLEHWLPLTRSELEAAGLKLRDLARVAPERVKDLLHAIYRRTIVGRDMAEALRVIREATAKDARATFTAAPARFRTMPELKAFVRDLDPGSIEHMTVEHGSPARNNLIEPSPHPIGERLSLPRVQLLGHDVPVQFAKTLNGWVELVESKHPGALPPKISLMSLREWSALHGVGVNKGTAGHVWSRGDEIHIAIDHSDMHDMQRVETMAHELGHVVSKRVIERLPEHERAAIDADYRNWLQRTAGLSPADRIRSRAPLGLGVTIDPHMTDHEYAAARKEWEADQIGRWLLTDAKPHSVVERVFHDIAGTIKALYQSLSKFLKDDGRAAPSIQQFMDRWISDARVELRHAEVAARGGGVLEHMRTADDAEHEPPRVPPPHILQRAVPAGVRELGKNILNAVGNRDIEALRAAGDRIEGSRAGRTVKRGMMRGAFTLQNMKDYTKSMGEFGKHVGSWVDEIFRRQQTAIRAGETGRRALERAMNLSGKTRAVLNELMHKATVYGIHPDKPFEDKANAHLRSADPDTTLAHHLRWRELNGLYRQLGNEGKIRGQDVYRELAGAFRKLYRDTVATQIRQVRGDSRLTAAERAEVIGRLQQSKATMLQGPYFPLVRDGDIITTAALPPQRIDAAPGHPFFETREEAEQRAKFLKAMNPHARIRIETTTDENGDKFHELWMHERAVYFHKSFNEAKDAHPQIMADMKADWMAATGKDWDTLSKHPEFADELKISDPKVKRDYYQDLLSVPSGFLQKIDSLNAKGEMDAGTHNALRMMYLESLPQFSYRKSTMPRANIRGADQDMLRAYAQRLTGATHNFAAVKHAKAIDEAWTNADKTATGDQHDVLNAAFLQQQQYYKRLQNTPLNNTLNLIADISSSFSLAYSPGFAIMNATQPLMTTMPVLAGMVRADGSLIGSQKAMKYLGEAYGNGAAGFFSKRAVTEMVTELKRLTGNKADGETLQESAQHIIDQFAKNDGERAMLQHLMDLGRLDFSFLNTQHDAATTAAGSKVRAAIRLGMTIPQQIESINRLVSALASHRIAVNELGMTHEQAKHFADDVVSQTQFVYDKLNRPEWFNHPLGSVVMQFKLFVQGMYSLAARNVAMMLKGETPEVRKQGMATLGYMLATNVGVGGATGLGPVYGAAKVALGMLAMAGLFGEDDKHKREQVGTDAWVEQLAREHLGDEGAAVAQRGLPTELGLDLSDRIGIPNLWDTRYMDLREGDSTSDTFDKTMLYALGAPYSNARKLVSLTGAAADLDGKEAAKNLPSGLRSIFAAADWARHGIVEKDGDTFIDSSELSPLDIVAKGFGLGSEKVNTAYRQRSQEFQTLDRMRTKRGELIAAYRNADGDLERAKVRADMDEFNGTVPKAFKISPSQLHQSLHQSQIRQRQGDPQRKAARDLIEG